MLRVYLLLVVFGVATFGLKAQTALQRRLDSLFSAIEKNNLAKGEVVIAQKGIPIYTKHFGNGNYNLVDKVAILRYRIGSITKLFTAVMVYQLVEEHKLALNTPLSRYFPNLPSANKITIAHMMGHRSGLPDFTKNTGFDNWKAKPKTHNELLVMIAARPAGFAPGTRAEYNNSNYLLLGYIIEAICKKPYGQVLEERITKPLSLELTYYKSDSTSIPQEARGYKYANYTWKPDEPAYLDNFGGAGGIISTAGNLSTFINALFSHKLVSAAHLKMMTSIKDGYGYGLFPYGIEGHAGFGHNGKTEAFVSSLSHYPDSALTIAYCSNGDVYPRNEILDGILKIYYRQPYEVPAFKIPTFNEVAVDSSLLKTYTGLYTDGKMTVLSGVMQDQFVLQLQEQVFPLVALDNTWFINRQYGYFIRFYDNGKKLTISEGDNTYTLYKK